MDGRPDTPAPGGEGLTGTGLLRFRSAPGRWVVAATVLGSAVAAVDGTVIGVALPTIGRDFHASVATLQWVVTGYTLTLSSLLLLGGSLGDRFGRKRVFLVGVVWFALASAACAVASGSTQLIVTRVLQGVGGALLTPGSLAILEASFSPDDRNEAIGAWSGLGGVATAVGPLLGGYLITAASWRWIFLINIPLGTVVLLMSARHVPESRDTSAGPIDALGAALGTLALAAISYALIEGPARGWSSGTVLSALAVGGVGAVSFVVVERRSSSPMLPLNMFRNRQFSVTNGVTFVVYAGLGGVLFLLPVVLQVSNGYSPLESGMALLPLTAVMLVASARSGRLATAIGPRLQMSVGPVVVGIGLALLVRAPGSASYVTGVLPAVLVLGAGLATTVAPLTATALNSVSDTHAGLASAVNNDVARIGGLIAVAVLPALGGITGTSYLSPHDLGHGFQRAVLIAASWCVVGGVVAALGIRNPPHRPSPGPTRPSYCALEATPLAGVEAGRPPERPDGRVGYRGRDA
jgi:EmrB/QacA subfamily drug resistance transporter